MNDKVEIFGVVWVDNMLGPLSLTKLNAPSAIEAARGIRERGVDKVRDVRAVHVAAGSDKMEILA